MDVLEELSRSTPYVAKMNPAAACNVPDFHAAGGVPAVMREILPLLHADALTVTGRTVAENVAGAARPTRGSSARGPTPWSTQGGLAVLRGNLAPRTAITKPAAIDPRQQVFSGLARCFDCEEAANQAILDGVVQPGEVVVIRYEGPKGGPGMREMYTSMKLLYGRGLALRDRGGHRRAILGDQQRLLRGPRLARGGRRRPAGRRLRRRQDHDRHPPAPTAPARRATMKSRTAWHGGNVRRCGSPAGTWPSTPAWLSPLIKGPLSVTGYRDGQGNRRGRHSSIGIDGLSQTAHDRGSPADLSCGEI